MQQYSSRARCVRKYANVSSLQRTRQKAVGFCVRGAPGCIVGPRVDEVPLARHLVERLPPYPAGRQRSVLLLLCQLVRVWPHRAERGCQATNLSSALRTRQVRQPIQPLLGASEPAARFVATGAAVTEAEQHVTEVAPSHHSLREKQNERCTTFK